MIKKISNPQENNRRSIQIFYPGLNYNESDTGIGSIGRIDYANISGNHTIAMHPHINDEILSYFRSGKAKHIDSEGNVEMMDKKRMMLMKAGKYFEHEEQMIDEGEPLEGLQIFIRPKKKDLNPQVTFVDLPQIHSENGWRLLASPNEDALFRFSSQTWIYDTKLTKRSEIALAEFDNPNLTALLLVFRGDALINSSIPLLKNECIIIKDEQIQIKTETGAELVVFVTDEGAEVFKGGMYSGNVTHK